MSHDKYKNDLVSGNGDLSKSLDKKNDGKKAG
jgi:hypothetical protein